MAHPAENPAVRPHVVRAILSCCSPFLTPQVAPPAGVSVGTLVRTATELGLAPAWAANVPPAWLQQMPALQAATKRIGHSAMAQALLADRLRKSIQALADELNVRLVVLKGAFAEAALYPRPGHRAMCDVDILASTSGCATLHHALVERGFQRLGSVSRQGGLADAFEWTYRPPSGTVLLDVHRYPCEPAYFSPDVSGWLERRVVVNTSHGPIPGLCPEDQVLHVALHAASHGFDLNLRNFLDLAQLIHRFPIHWSAVQSRAHEAGAQAPLWITLTIMAELFGWGEGRRLAEAVQPSWWRQKLLAWRVGWEDGALHAYGANNRSRIITGIFPLLSGPGRAGSFLVTYARRRVMDLLLGLSTQRS